MFSTLALSQSPINSGDIQRKFAEAGLIPASKASQSPINSGDIQSLYVYREVTGAAQGRLNPLLIAGTFRVSCHELNKNTKGVSMSQSPINSGDIQRSASAHCLGLAASVSIPY